ncbi:predicted protein [Botrytis cinerea T4]|uniref:Uncharacterized protein n=1 Tax=Botryotinia fuckeliana (strain T4) TaxID=999810 RepID=G2YRZ7_BOTF4|nr:predicted protein [Botrytis cinerea T4]
MYYRNLLSTFTQVDMKGAWKLWAEDCRNRVALLKFKDRHSRTSFLSEKLFSKSAAWSQMMKNLHWERTALVEARLLSTLSPNNFRGKMGSALSRIDDVIQIWTRLGSAVVSENKNLAGYFITLLRTTKLEDNFTTLLTNQSALILERTSWSLASELIDTF